VSDLRASDNADSSSGRGRLFSRRNLLVIAQVSLSLALLSAAGLFIRSSVRMAGVNPGFSLENRVVAEFDAGLAGYDETRGRQVYTPPPCRSAWCRWERTSSPPAPPRSSRKTLASIS
jgi:hypothetical protein